MTFGFVAKLPAGMCGPSRRTSIFVMVLAAWPRDLKANRATVRHSFPENPTGISCGNPWCLSSQGWKLGISGMKSFRRLIDHFIGLWAIEDGFDVLILA